MFSQAIAVAPDPHIPWTRLLARLEVNLGDGPDPYNLKSIAGRLHDALVETCQTQVHVDVIRLDHLAGTHRHGAERHGGAGVIDAGLTSRATTVRPCRVE